MDWLKNIFDFFILTILVLIIFKFVFGIPKESILIRMQANLINEQNKLRQILIDDMNNISIKQHCNIEDSQTQDIDLGLLDITNRATPPRVVQLVANPEGFKQGLLLVYFTPAIPLSGISITGYELSISGIQLRTTQTTSPFTILQTGYDKYGNVIDLEKIAENNNGKLYVSIYAKLTSGNLLPPSDINLDVLSIDYTPGIPTISTSITRMSRNIVIPRPAVINSVVKGQGSKIIINYTPAIPENDKQIVKYIITLGNNVKTSFNISDNTRRSITLDPFGAGGNGLSSNYNLFIIAEDNNNKLSISMSAIQSDGSEMVNSNIYDFEYGYR